MAEFFVLKNLRGKGLSQKFLKHILEKHKGDWCVGAVMRNKRAVKFWEKCLDDISLSRTEHFDGEEWKFFNFTIRDQSQIHEFPV